MKKITIIAAVGISSLFTQSFSQTNEVIERQNRFYIAPIDLFFNTIQLGYERQLKNHNSIAAFGGFTLSKENNEVSDIGGTAELQYRINLLYNKEALSLVSRRYSTFAFFAPYFSYRYEEITDIGYYGSRSGDTTSFIDSYFGGFGFGCRFTGLENRFCLNIFLGGGLKYSFVNGLDKYTEFIKPGYTGIAPKLGFDMGIAF